jgi:hypothetical protein
VGPFYLAGLTSYRIESHFFTRKGEDRTPDIVAGNEDNWMILDITTQLKSKEHQLKTYESIDKNNLGQYGLPIPIQDPDLLVSRTNNVKDGDYCQLILDDTIRVNNHENLQNPRLINSLNQSIGTNLSHLPEIPISLLPEMGQKEIRMGLIDIVLQLFTPESEGKTAMEMVNEGLERIAENTSISAKRALRDKIRDAMKSLISTYLRDYLIEDNGRYRSTDKFRKMHQTMNRINIIMKEWVQQIPPTTLYDFDETPNGNSG